MTLDEAKQSQRIAYDQLYANSTHVDGDASANLGPINGVPVVVRRVPAAVIQTITGAAANGTPMHYDGQYVIFLSDAPAYTSPHTPSLVSPWLDRLCVLHEYGHIVSGDVFEDDPDRLFKIYMDKANGCPMAAAEVQEMELRADRYAFPRLLSEVKSAGESALAAELVAEMNARGL